MPLNLLLIYFDALHDLVPFVQLKKPEIHPWRSVNFTKRTFPHGHFSRFLNCTGGTEVRKVS